MVSQSGLWLKVAKELGIAVVSPCDVTLADGTHVQATALVKEFGARNGMVVDPEWSALKPYADALLANGYGYSAVALGPDCQASNIVEMLADWGWSGQKPEPTWLTQRNEG